MSFLVFRTPHTYYVSKVIVFILNLGIVAHKKRNNNKAER